MRFSDLPTPGYLSSRFFRKYGVLSHRTSVCSLRTLWTRDSKAPSPRFWGGGKLFERLACTVLTLAQAINIFDSGDHSQVSEWLAKDYTATQPSGVDSEASGNAAFEAIKSLHEKLLTEYRHVLTSTIVVDMENGYKIMSYADMYANLLAVSALNPMKISDPDGKKWDLKVPCFSEWDLVKDANSKHHGLLIKSTKAIFDQNEVLERVKQKGVDVTGWLSK